MRARVRTGKTVRIPKRGVRFLNGGEYGDHYVTFTVDIPTSLKDRQVELLKEFDKEERRKAGEVVDEVPLEVPLAKEEEAAAERGDADAADALPKKEAGGDGEAPSGDEKSGKGKDAGWRSWMPGGGD